MFANAFVDNAKVMAKGQITIPKDIREVLGVASIFTYGMRKGRERLAAASVKNRSLTTFDAVAAVAAEQNYIRPDEVARLLRFRDDPSDSAWMAERK